MTPIQPRKRIKWIVLLLAIVGLASCVCGAGIIYVRDLPLQLHASTTLQAVEALADHLPLPPDAVLLDRKDTTEGHDTPGCWLVSTYRWYGTNDLTLDQVLSFYDHTLDRSFWQPDLFDSHGHAFSHGQEDLFLDIDDHYPVPPNIDLRHAAQHVKTVFIVTLVRRLDPDTPRSLCT